MPETQDTEQRTNINPTTFSDEHTDNFLHHIEVNLDENATLDLLHETIQKSLTAFPMEKQVMLLKGSIDNDTYYILTAHDQQNGVLLRAWKISNDNIIGRHIEPDMLVTLAEKIANNNTALAIVYSHESTEGHTHREEHEEHEEHEHSHEHVHEHHEHKHESHEEHGGHSGTHHSGHSSHAHASHPHKAHKAHKGSHHKAHKKHTHIDHKHKIHISHEKHSVHEDHHNTHAEHNEQSHGSHAVHTAHLSHADHDNHSIHLEHHEGHEVHLEHTGHEDHAQHIHIHLIHIHVHTHEHNAQHTSHSLHTVHSHQGHFASHDSSHMAFHNGVHSHHEIHFEHSTHIHHDEIHNHHTIAPVIHEAQEANYGFFSIYLMRLLSALYLILETPFLYQQDTLQSNENTKLAIATEENDDIKVKIEDTVQIPVIEKIVRNMRSEFFEANSEYYSPNTQIPQQSLVTIKKKKKLTHRGHIHKTQRIAA